MSVAALVASGADAAGPTQGPFSNSSDIGSVSRRTEVKFDRAANTYVVTASGANMWLAQDDFGFVWKRSSGDFALTAEIALSGSSTDPHRKGLLMVRQSLDPAAAYADIAVHGDGLASLQFRSEPGGVTREIRCPIRSPRRVRLEKRGAYVAVSIAGADGAMSESGCFVRLSWAGDYYLGLGVCAHDNRALTTGTFSHVELTSAPPRIAAQSALEVVPLASLDRAVVYRGKGRMESPVFSADGQSLYFSRAGRIERLVLTDGSEPQAIDTGVARACNNDHGISPDGTKLVISDLSAVGKSLIYVLPIGGTPQRVPVDAPAYWHSWSPDGATLAYCAARGGNYDIYLIPVAGGREMRLTTDAANDNGPDFTPDGKSIYFHSDRSGSVQIWRMRADGSAQEQVTNDGYENWFPHPSPDGKWVAVLSTKQRHATGHPPDGDYFLRLISTAPKSAPKEIARFYGGNGSVNVPCWSRDSTRLAYSVYAPPEFTDSSQ